MAFLPKAKPIKLKKKPAVPPPLKVWAMVQLTSQGERCKSWKALLVELRNSLGQPVEAYFPGIWIDDDFDERAQLIEGYLFVEHREDNEYSNLYDPRAQRNHYFKGVVHNGDKLKPETLTDEQLKKTKEDVKRRLIPMLEPGAYFRIQRGDWRKAKAFIEVVTRTGMVCCKVRTPEKMHALILTKECFARDPEGTER